MKLDRFYPIVDSSAWLDRVLPLGVKLVQLRVKNRSVEAVREEVRRTKKRCLEHRCVLVVNDYWQIAIDEGCDFVHLGQSDLDDADLPAIRRAGIHVGISTHDDAELERALQLDPAYVALGPIYPTRLKEMPWAPQGLERVAEWKRRIGALPLVAIGGLTVERASQVIAAGADVLSVVTDVLLHPSPESRTCEWIREVNESRPTTT
ncbi:MAG: thiamine phosphate synthase [Myxococcota bacterium]